MAEFNEKNGYIIEGQYYQYNLEWLIRKILEFEESIQTIIDLQTIHYADPIQWDITTQYAPNTVVVDAKTGIAYMSKKAVPAGILLSNEDFWVVIFNYQKIYDKIMTGVAFNDMDNPTATKDLQVNDLVWFQGDLYRATRAITEGSKYIVGTNITPTSIESLLATYYGRDRVAQVTNDTVNVSGDYTLNAGDIAETSDNRTIKVTKDNEVDIDGSDSLHVDGVTTINRGGAVTEVNAASVDRKTVGKTTEQYGDVQRTYAGKVVEEFGQRDSYITTQETFHGKRVAILTDDPLMYGKPTASSTVYADAVDMIGSDNVGYKVLTQNDLTARLDGLLSLPFVKVTDYGADPTGTADSTAAFQSAMRANVGVIVIPKGTYTVSGVRIPSDKHVVGYGAKLVAKTGTGIFMNDADGVTGGTKANANITIEGVDFSAPSLYHCGCIGMSHVNNVRVINCTFHDIQAWHFIELNSAANCIIDNCLFYNYGVSGNDTYTEMIQFDFASEEAVFPWFGPYDSTPLTNCKVTNCSFLGNGIRKNYLPAAVGNHTSGENKIQNIDIANCYMEGLGSACKFATSTYLNFHHNTVRNCNSGVFCYSYVNQLTVDSNKMSGASDVSESLYYRGVCTQRGSLSEYINVSNNELVNFGNHGIAVEGRLITITNNRVVGSGRNGIYLAYGQFGVTVSGNNIWGSGRDTSGAFYDMFINPNVGGLGAGATTGDIFITGNKFGSGKIEAVPSDLNPQMIILDGNAFKTALTTNAASCFHYYDNWIAGVRQAGDGIGATTRSAPSATVSIPAATFTTVCSAKAPSAGLYEVSGQVAMNANGTYQGGIRLAGTQMNSYDFTIDSSSSRTAYNRCTVTMALTAGQEVKLEVWNKLACTVLASSDLRLTKIA